MHANIKSNNFIGITRLQMLGPNIVCWLVHGDIVIRKHIFKIQFQSRQIILYFMS